LESRKEIAICINQATVPALITIEKILISKQNEKRESIAMKIEQL